MILKTFRKLVSKLNEGFDVCVGWRKSQEGKLYREKPSRFMNWLISRISAVKLHDYECALRAYRTEAVRGLRLSGNLDLYIPVYVSWQGGRITEVSVTQLPRSHGHGVSENRTKRTLKTLLDLVFLKFLQRYSTKPLYVFGSLGIVSLLSSFVSFGFMVFYKMTGGPSFIETPLPLLTALFFLTGLMLLVLGNNDRIFDPNLSISTQEPSFMILLKNQAIRAKQGSNYSLCAALRDLWVREAKWHWVRCSML